MTPFKIETSLDYSNGLTSISYGHGRLSTRIQVAGREEFGQDIQLGPMVEPHMLDYILEKHFHDLKQHILNKQKDQLFRESPEYQRMQRQIEEANRKLDDIADISDPDER